jgi:hypothetical protein
MRTTRFLTAIPLLALLHAAGLAYAQEAPGPLEQTVPVADEAAPDAAAEMSDEDALAEAFSVYKQLMADGVLDEADVAAKRIVEMTIRLYGPNSTETAKALTNLAIVQHRSEQYDAAQQNFASAIEIIEDIDDRLSFSLVNPLKGLGAAQLEGGRPDLAAGTFNRAAHVTHVNEGPHNMEQIEILESLAETNYRLGLIEDAKKAQDRIYALNRRFYDSRPLGLIQPLMRRAAWQHRTGHYHDERATYRSIVRIIESQTNKDDLSLVEPLMQLGKSYYYIDLTASQPYQASQLASGEMYFKRAHRIAEMSAEASYLTVATTKLALADYYLSQASQGRARNLYAEAWEILSKDESRLEDRYRSLEVPVKLKSNPVPQYVGNASSDDRMSPDEQLLTGTISAVFDITIRGRVANLRITAMTPPEFTDIKRFVERELRGRLYRPAFVNGNPVESTGQEFTHNFYYRQSDLDRIRDEEANKAQALEEQDER